MKLKDYVNVNYDEENIYIFYRDGIKIENTETNMTFIKKLIDGIEQEYYEQECQGFINIIDLLVKHNFISYFESSKYHNTKEERLLCYLDQYRESPQELYHRLVTSRVCIIGLGGTGGNILQILMSSGIKDYVLIDFDKVEYSNLNRQYMYDINDVGRFKTEICKEKLLQFDPSISCLTYNKMIKEESDILDFLDSREIDVLVAAADSPVNIKDVIYNVAKVKKCAYVEGGLGVDYGRYLFLEPKNLDIYGMIENKGTLRCLNNVVPKGSFGATNSIISSFMAMDIVNYLIGKETWSKNGKILIDFLDKKVTKFS